MATETKLNPTQMTREQVLAMTDADVLDVYSGKPGCACGCNGKYSYNPNYQKEGGKRRGYEVDATDCNIGMVRKVMRLIQENVDNPKLERGDTYFHLPVHEARVYTLYVL